MRLWQKLWLLFTVIWVVVAALQALTIFYLSEEQDRALQPALLGVAVPAILYAILWLISLWRSRRRAK